MFDDMWRSALSMGLSQLESACQQTFDDLCEALAGTNGLPSYAKLSPGQRLALREQAVRICASVEEDPAAWVREHPDPTGVERLAAARYNLSLRVQGVEHALLADFETQGGAAGLAAVRRH